MSRSFAIRPALAGLAGLAGIALAGQVAADDDPTVQCGDVVRGTAQLEQDLTCDTNPALTVRGVLDLNGFSVTCLNPDEAEQAGVVLQGHGAILRNGAVEACFRSVVLAGRGGHLVTQVTANGTNRGFSVESGSNRIVGNRASSRDNDAFRIEGRHNLLSGNTVTSAGGDGFGIRGRRNIFAGNEVTAVGEEGFDIRERFNEVLSNHVSEAGDDGIQVRTGGNRIASNTISGSKGRGILLGGFLSAPAGSNEIVGNSVTDGEQEGINVDQGFVRQRILDNTAEGNALADLRDQNPDCDHNRWSGNTFGTADPADCIH